MGFLILLLIPLGLIIGIIGYGIAAVFGKEKWANRFYIFGFNSFFIIMGLILFVTLMGWIILAIF